MLRRKIRALECWRKLGGVGDLGKVGKEGFAVKITFQKRERAEWMSGDQRPLWREQQSEPQRGCAQ